MSNDSQPEVHEICLVIEVCFQIDREPIVRETSFAMAEVVTNKAEAQKPERKKATLTMSECEAKGKRLKLQTRLKRVARFFQGDQLRKEVV